MFEGSLIEAFPLGKLCKPINQGTGKPGIPQQHLNSGELERGTPRWAGALLVSGYHLGSRVCCGRRGAFRRRINFGKGFFGRHLFRFRLPGFWPGFGFIKRIRFDSREFEWLRCGILGRHADDDFQFVGSPEFGHSLGLKLLNRLNGGAFPKLLLDERYCFGCGVNNQAEGAGFRV